MDRDLRILVVDDFAAMRDIVTGFLRDLGYRRIDEAADGRAAWGKLRSGDYDLLLTNWNMPEMDGLELLGHVRADEALADLPVLMVTAEARRDQIVRAADAGVDAYLIKPFTADVLADKIRALFEHVPEA
ncbi:MAG: response regulator [Gammaproteobacteria bacterium]